MGLGVKLVDADLAEGVVVERLGGPQVANLSTRFPVLMRKTSPMETLRATVNQTYCELSWRIYQKDKRRARLQNT